MHWLPASSDPEAAPLEVAARIFLQTPTGRESRGSTQVVVGEAAVRRVAERLAEGSPVLLRRLQHAIVRHEMRPTWRTREQVVEAVTAVALSLALTDDTSGCEALTEGELG